MNNQVFKLSKRFGMLTLFDFFQFPDYNSNYPAHMLAGIESPGYVFGEHNLSFKDIFSFVPGDVFHVCDSGWCGPHAPPPVSRKVNRILDLAWSQGMDTVTCKIEVLSDSWLGLGSDPHIYRRDTIYQTYNAYSDDYLGLDDLPEQPVFYQNSTGELRFVNFFTQSRGQSYNSHWLKSKNNSFDPVSVCSDTLIGKNISHIDYHSVTYYYIEGC